MSEKNRDDKNRWRSITVGFRMSPEESDELNNRVKLCGFRSKQDYLIQSSLHQKINVVGNPLMLVQFRQNLQRIERELLRINEVSEELSECLISADDVESHIDEVVLTGIINDFLSQLSAEQRKVFVRRYWYFCSINEIAAENGISKSKVKMMLLRIRNELKAKLEKEFFI